MSSAPSTGARACTIHIFTASIEQHDRTHLSALLIFFVLSPDDTFEKTLHRPCLDQLDPSLKYRQLVYDESIQILSGMVCISLNYVQNIGNVLL